MSAVIESLSAGQQRDDAVTFSWAELLQLEAACCSRLASLPSTSRLSRKKQRQTLLPDEKSSFDAVTVLLLPRSALLLASVLACMRLQLPWVILSPSSAPDEIIRHVDLLPYTVAACVSLQQCEQSAVAATSQHRAALLYLDLPSQPPHPPTNKPVELDYIPPHLASSPPPPVLPDYFTFTSGSSGVSQCVTCSGRSLWSRLITQVSSSAPLQGIVPPEFRAPSTRSIDWRQLLLHCANHSDASARAVGGSVCVWKTAVAFCDTVVEMLQGVTHGATQVIICSDGGLSVRCSCVALALCGRESAAQPQRAVHTTMFNVQAMFTSLHLHRVSHLTAVPSLISSLLALEESCCPHLHRGTTAPHGPINPTDLSLRGCLFQSLRALCSSGEPLPCSLVERVRALLLRHDGAKLSLINVYGCAETTADASCVELRLPHDKCMGDWGTVVPLGRALAGSCIGVIAGCADGSCGLSARLPGTSSASAAEPIVISWLHDAAAPVGAGRVVVGGACVAKGYAADMKHRGFELQPELSRALLLTKLDSFFARVHISNPKGNAAEALPVFVTMDTAEIVTVGGERLLLYRGRQALNVQKLKGVFVSLERVEHVAQSLSPFPVTIAAAGGEWACCVSTSAARAAFQDDSVRVVVAFDFVFESVECAAPAMKSVSRFSSRGELHAFLCSSVHLVLKQQLCPESVPALYGISVYCMNAFFAGCAPVQEFAAIVDALPPRAQLLASGKLDLRAASCGFPCEAAEVARDRNSKEVNTLAVAIASCFSRIVGIKFEAPLHANFFDMGLDSLKGTSLLIAVQALHTHGQIPFDALVQNPSATALARYLCRSASCAKTPLRPMPVAHDASARLLGQPTAVTLSRTQVNDFTHFSAEDHAATLIMEWLPNASVRLWKMQDESWESRTMCMASVIPPAVGFCSDHCSRLAQARWNVDMGACVDASPLTCALRRTAFDLTEIHEEDDEMSMLPGFSVIAIIGSHTGLVVAVHVTTGDIVWRAALPDRVEPGASSAVLHPHSCSVLVGCYDGCLYALCICKGNVKWRFDTNAASFILKAAPAHADVGSAKRPKLAGKETLLNPDKEPLKGGVCLIGCSCCVACSTWTKCSAMIGVAGYSKRFFAIELVSVGRAESCFSCDIDGSVVAQLLSCPCCSGSSSVIVAATSGWLTSLSMHQGQQFAKDWSTNMGGPLFSSPVCLPSSQSPSLAVASATGHVLVVSIANGHTLQRLQPYESPSSFMSAPRVVLSSLNGRLLIMLSSAGGGGVLVLGCAVSGIFAAAELTAEIGSGGTSFVSSPCIYRLESLRNKNSFVALAFLSDGKLYAAACDCDRMTSSIKIPMHEVFDAKCGVYCSPAVVPVRSFGRNQAPTSDVALIQQQMRVVVSVVMGGRDNMMRCLQE